MKRILHKKPEPLGNTCRKRMFGSAEEAKESAEYLKQATYIKDLSVYKCTVCGFWHLTRRSPKGPAL